MNVTLDGGDVATGANCLLQFVSLALARRRAVRGAWPILGPTFRVTFGRAIAIRCQLDFLVVQVTAADRRVHRSRHNRRPSSLVLNVEPIWVSNVELHFTFWLTNTLGCLAVISYSLQQSEVQFLDKGTLFGEVTMP